MTSSTDIHLMQVRNRKKHLYKGMGDKNSQPNTSVIKKSTYKSNTYSGSSVLAALASGDIAIDASLLGVFSLDLSSLVLPVLLPAALAGDREVAGESLPIEDDDKAIFPFLL